MNSIILLSYFLHLYLLLQCILLALQFVENMNSFLIILIFDLIN
jgi:hypothetical protein